VRCRPAARQTPNSFSSPDSLRELRGRFRQEGIHGFPRAYQVVVKGRTDNVLLISFRYEAHRVLDRTRALAFGAARYRGGRSGFGLS